MSRVLVVEDERGSATALGIYLKHIGHEARVLTDARDALRVARSFQPDIVVCDWVLGRGFDGLELARAVHALRPAIRFVLMTGMPGLALDQRLAKTPVDHVLCKPVSLGELGSVVGALAAGRPRPTSEGTRRVGGPG